MSKVTCSYLFLDHGDFDLLFLFISVHPHHHLTVYSAWTFTFASTEQDKMPLDHIHRMEKFYASFSPQLKWTPLFSVMASPFNHDRTDAATHQYARKLCPGNFCRDSTEEPHCQIPFYWGQTRTVAKTCASVGPRTRYVSSVNFPLASHSQDIMHEPLFLILLFIRISSFFWPQILC